MAVVAFAAAACGGSDDETVAAPTARTIIETVIVEKEGPMVVATTIVEVTKIVETTKIVEVTVAPMGRSTLNGTVVVAAVVTRST